MHLPLDMELHLTLELCQTSVDPAGAQRKGSWLRHRTKTSAFIAPCILRTCCRNTIWLLE